MCAVWQVRIPTASVINTCDTSIAHRLSLIHISLAGEICNELGKDLNHEFLDNETGYLAIHIEQIKCDEMVSE